MKKTAFLAFLLMLSGSRLLQAGSAAGRLSPAQFMALASRCAPEVPPETLFSIARVESALLSYALSLNYPKRAGQRMGVGPSAVSLAAQPRSTAEAAAWARWLLRRRQGVSIGLMQISSDNLSMLGLTLEQAFEPCSNVRAGALLLAGKYHRAAATLGQGQAALRAALSAYNTGSLTAGLSNGYVGRVMAASNLASQSVTVPTVTSPPSPTSTTDSHGSPEDAATGVAWR